MYLYVLLISAFTFCNSYKICIMGGSSGLGRELIYQGIKCQNIQSITALSNNTQNIYIPYRNGGLSDLYMTNNNKVPIYSSKLQTLSYVNFWNKKHDYFDSIVFCTSGTAFSQDKSDYLTIKTIESIKNIKPSTKLLLISAFGVNQKTNNVGIIGMRNWYLKDVYEKKAFQESYLQNLNKGKLYVFKPNVLSYGYTTFPSLSREKFAGQLLDIITKS